MGTDDNTVELGLAEFVFQLISETFDAVTGSVIDQSEKVSAVAESANQPLADFAAENVTDAEIDRRLGELFPPKDEQHPHAIYRGAEYTPGDGGQLERPPVRERLGLVVEREHVTKSASKGVRLSNAGVEAIRRAAGIALAAERQESVRLLVSEGVPRIVVDSGRITSKVTLAIRPTGDPGGSATNDPGVATASASFAKGPIAEFASRPRFPVRLVVRPADPASPQSGRAAEVHGEIEIAFKTVQ
jgi:hypothetical protein